MELRPHTGVPMARRYAVELDERLTVEERDKQWTFQGDHGCYHINKHESEYITCDCSFYTLRSTCSHTIVVTLENEYFVK